MKTFFNKKFTHILAILSMLFWGMSFVWSKIVFKYYGPLTTIFLRLVISGIILFLYIKIFGKNQKIDKADYKSFALLAFFQPFCYFLGESFGLNIVSPTIASVIIATIPVFTPIFAFIFVKEKLSIWNFFGIMVSFAGVFLMVVNKKFSLDAAPAGIFLLLFAVSSAIAYSIVIKKLVKKYSPITIITNQNILGACYFLPLFLYFDFNKFIHVQPNTELILSLIQLSFFASTIAYIFLVPVIRDLGINKTNLYTNLIPVFTAVFSYFIVNESFTLFKVLGILVVIIGVTISDFFKIKSLLIKTVTLKKQK